jgi:hypothetical protein
MDCLILGRVKFCREQVNVVDTATAVQFPKMLRHFQVRCKAAGYYFYPKALTPLPRC